MLSGRVGSAQLSIPGRSPQLRAENRCGRMASILALPTCEGRGKGELVRKGAPGGSTVTVRPDPGGRRRGNELRWESGRGKSAMTPGSGRRRGGGQVPCLESQVPGSHPGGSVCLFIHSFMHLLVKSVIHSSSSYCGPTVWGRSWVLERDWDPDKKALRSG